MPEDSMPEDSMPEDLEPEQGTADLRQVWGDFARSQGGTFNESERRGAERVSPGFAWRPVMQIPLHHSWTITIEAVRQAMLESWRKERSSLRDVVAPGGGRSYDFTTTLSLRYRSRDGFTFGISRGTGDSLTEMKRNIEIGAAIELTGLRGVRVHTRDELTARSVLRPRVIEALNATAVQDLPLDLHIERASRWFGLSRSRTQMELRLRVGTLLNDADSLAAHLDIVRELFDGLRRANSVQEQSGYE